MEEKKITRVNSFKSRCDV